MSEEQTKVAPDIIDMLVEALVQRIKAKLMPEIEVMLAKVPVKIEVEDIKGLDDYIGHSIEDYDRNNSHRVDADDVHDLEEFIKETMKQASISIDF